MTPNFVAAIVAIASFATAFWMGSPNIYAIWVYTFLMASLYGLVVCVTILVCLYEDKQCWIPAMNVTTIGFAIAFAIPYRKGMLPAEWTMLGLVFWSLPLINWGLNLWLTYNLIEDVHVRWNHPEETVWRARSSTWSREDTRA